MAPSPPSVKWKAHFTPSQQNLSFHWKPFKSIAGKFINPVDYSLTCADLLWKDAFFDKSAALYNLLERRFEGRPVNDFRSVVLLLVYPGRFGKTTLLAFIEAVFSPVPMLGKFETQDLKTKISALKRGKQLFEFGLHPVLYLDLQGVCSVDNLNNHIAAQFQRAGLNSSEVAKVNEGNLSSTDRVRRGVAILVDKFSKETGAASRTIVLIDEYDKPFRDQNRRQDDELLTELNHIFELGNVQGSGISLLVLCGLTRMAGRGVTKKVDVSQNSDYHGLCGISANELVTSANGQLDRNGQTVKSLVSESGMGGFRFGFDEVKHLTGADLLSPMDIWEIVGSMLESKKPEPQWSEAAQSNFDFASFAENFTSSDEGSKELLATLEEGWVNPTDVNFNLNREQYLLLDHNLCLRKVLFELGLLTVKNIDADNKIQLGPPNEIVKGVATDLLENKRRQGLIVKMIGSSKIDSKNLKFENTKKLVEQNITTKISKGTVITISCYESDDMEPVSLYIRKHWEENFTKVNKFFKDTTKRKYYVNGAPGCGKTCFFWIWALSLTKQKKRVLFIQFRHKGYCQVWILEGTERKRLVLPDLNANDLIKVIKGLLRGWVNKEKFDVCICDGVLGHEPTCNTLLSMLDSWSGVNLEWAVISKLVIVTSLQFRVLACDERIGDGHIADRISFDSWREVEHKEAAESALVASKRAKRVLQKDWHFFFTGLKKSNRELDGERPLDRDQILEVVSRKYYFAGGSARHMFDTNMVDVLKNLKRDFLAVKDPISFTRTSMVGMTDEALNSLMQQFSVNGESVCTPVSKYVMVCAYDHCRSKLTDAVKAAASATNNASLRVWGYEMGQNDIIDSALAANRSGFYSSYFTTAAVKNSKLVFSPKSKNEYKEGEIEGNVVSGAVIRGPFNQGLFDVALYFGTTLVTLQFTLSERHSLELEYLTSIRNALLRKGLQVTRMAHLTVLEKDMLGRFNFDKATGAVCGPDEHLTLRSNNITPKEVEVGQSEELTKVERFTLLGGDTVQTLKKIYCPQETIRFYLR